MVPGRGISQCHDFEAAEIAVKKVEKACGIRAGELLGQAAGQLESVL